MFVTHTCSHDVLTKIIIPTAHFSLFHYTPLHLILHIYIFHYLIALSALKHFSFIHHCYFALTYCAFAALLHFTFSYCAPVAHCFLSLCCSFLSTLLSFPLLLFFIHTAFSCAFSTSSPIKYTIIHYCCTTCSIAWSSANERPLFSLVACHVLDLSLLHVLLLISRPSGCWYKQFLF